MKLTLKVTPTEGDAYTVQTNLFTIVALERKFKIKASDLATGIGLEYMAFLAFEACKQHSITVPAVFDDYIKRIESVELVTGDEANPTEAAVTSEP